MFSVEQLAEHVNEWCELHHVSPANGQAGENMTVRNIRYYRTLGLIDPPATGGGTGFGEKHRLQLIAIRLLQSQGLPLSRIQQLLFGRSLDELKRIETQGLAELNESPMAPFDQLKSESWSVIPLNREFMLVSRHGRDVSQELLKKLMAVLAAEQRGNRQYLRGLEGKTQ